MDNAVEEKVAVNDKCLDKENNCCSHRTDQTDDVESTEDIENEISNTVDLEW